MSVSLLSSSRSWLVSRSACSPCWMVTTCSLPSPNWRKRTIWCGSSAGLTSTPSSQCSSTWCCRSSSPSSPTPMKLSRCVKSSYAKTKHSELEWWSPRGVAGNRYVRGKKTMQIYHLNKILVHLETIKMFKLNLQTFINSNGKGVEKLNTPCRWIGMKVSFTIFYCSTGLWQNYQKQGLLLTDLQKFLAEQLDYSNTLETHQTNARNSFPVLCCFKRYLLHSSTWTPFWQLHVLQMWQLITQTWVTLSLRALLKGG